MRKRKILFVTEAHFHPTGYSVYTKEVLSRLHKHPEFEVAELACFVGPECEELKNSPWKIYPNMPPASNQEAMNAYNSSMSNKFGEFSLNNVLLDFKPDFVMDIRDVWMCLRRNTKIFTSKGLVNVQNIKTGDLVLTHTGNYRPVLNTFSRDYSGKMYNIRTPYDLFAVNLTEKHPVLVLRRTKRSRMYAKNIQWINSEEVKTGDLLCFPISQFGDKTEDLDFLTFRAYYLAYRFGVAKTILKLKIPKDKSHLINEIAAAFEKICENTTTVKAVEYKKHYLVSIETDKEIVNKLNDLESLFDLDINSATYFIHQFLKLKLETAASGKNAKIIIGNREVKSLIFRMLLRYNILPCVTRQTLRAKDHRSVKNLHSLAEGSGELLDHPRIRFNYAFLRVRKNIEEQASETVYNFEVEEDNSYVSAYAIHNCEHIERSPFREFFNFALMPTVDAEPQNPQWINVFSRADGIFAYSEFGRDTMLKQSRHINFVDVASPCASDVFFPMDKKEIRKEFGLDENAVIFGTVMRNQRRKLFPNLFSAFRTFLDNNPDMDNVYLYCHTGYPDVGWDIPALILEFGLASKVLLTYKCRHCGKVSVSFFNDAVKTCFDCGNLSSQVVGVGNKMDETDLAKIYNLFDVYIQWANCEGWGVPQTEAAKCGLPVVSVNYSAMASFVKNVEGVGIDPLGYYKELETGCKRAIPDDEALAHVMYRMVAFPDYRKQVAEACYSNYMKLYHWDDTAKKWADYFLSQPLKSLESTWNAPAKTFNPQTVLPNNIDKMAASDQITWLFINVLGKPEWVNNVMWQRLVKDLTYKLAMSTDIPGYYWNDLSHPDLEKRYESFDIQKAHQLCLNLREHMNQWERLRHEKNQIHK